MRCTRAQLTILVTVGLCFWGASVTYSQSNEVGNAVAQEPVSEPGATNSAAADSIVAVDRLGRSNESRLALGFLFGSSHLQGDRDEVIPGFGTQMVVRYRLNSEIDLSAGFGYTELNYALKESNTRNTTDIFNFDLQASYWSPRLAQNWQGYAGLGVSLLSVNVQHTDFRRFWDAALSLGVGIATSHNGTSVSFGVDYKFVMADTIDNVALGNEGMTNDGYLTTRFGVMYALGKR